MQDEYAWVIGLGACVRLLRGCRILAAVLALSRRTHDRSGLGGVLPLVLGVFLGHVIGHVLVLVMHMRCEQSTC